MGVYISGVRPGVIDGVLLENVRVELDKWSSVPGGRYDRRPFNAGVGIYESPTSGFHIDTADDVTLRHCEVAWGANRPEYFRHALSSTRAPGLVIEDLRGSAAHLGLEKIVGQPD